MQAIMDAALDAVVVIGADGRILDFSRSAERMFGIRAAAACGRRLDELIIPERFRERHREGLARAVAGGDAPFVGRRLELSALRAGGGEFPAEVTVARLDVQGRPSFVGFIRDVTRRRQAERELLDRGRQLRALSFELAMAEERERRRVAAGLHDLVGHPLALAKLQLGELCAEPISLEALTTLKEVGDLIARALEESRSLSFELGSPVLYELGLETALRSLGKRMARRHGFRFRYSGDSVPKPLAEEGQVVLYRVVEELLVNVVKHARARIALVTVRRVEGEVWITVEDDGVGLSAGRGNLLVENGGLGLFGARERLERIGGRLIIEAGDGGGTRILAVAPLEATEGSR